MSLHHSHTNHHILHSFIHTPIITYSTQSVTHQSSCTPLNHSHTNHQAHRPIIQTPSITHPTQSFTRQSSSRMPLNHSNTNHQAHRAINHTPIIKHPTQSFTLQSSSTPLKQLHTNHQAHNSIIHTPTLMAHRYTQSLTHQSSSTLKHSQTKQRVHHHLGSTKSVMVDGSLIGKVRLGERWMGGRGREGRGGMWARGGNMSMNRKLCECVCGE